MPVDSAVEFKDVSFTYPDTKKAILDQISFKIKKRFLDIFDRSQR